MNINRNEKSYRSIRKANHGLIVRSEKPITVLSFDPVMNMKFNEKPIINNWSIVQWILIRHLFNIYRFFLGGQVVRVVRWSQNGYTHIPVRDIWNTYSKLNFILVTILIVISMNEMSVHFVQFDWLHEFCMSRFYKENKDVF